jgi:5-methylcytosine-specific restriction endonuclease McrA
MGNEAKWRGSVYAPSKHREINEWARLLVIVRDGHTCRVDGCKATRSLELHHIWPVAEGGKDDVENLVLLCRKHHNEIEAAGTLHTMAEVKAWGSNSGSDKSLKKYAAKSEDWQSWVYGGAQNPNK